MKAVSVPLMCSLSLLGVYANAAPLPDANTLTWKTIAFGQSTDINFATNVLPEKIGVNGVTTTRGTALPDGPLKLPFSIESRGGKIGNSHDGLTFYFTRVPAETNAMLEADITVDQFGPENGALPAGQEGAGLMIRDIPGKPRQQELKMGYEELPSASNMVMNAIMTQDKKDHHRIMMTLLSRNGVLNSWGNEGIEMIRDGYQPNVNLQQTPRIRLRLARTNSGFTASYAPYGSDRWVTRTTDDPQRVTVQEKEAYYVGFFASRNARITVNSASLQLSRAELSAPRAPVSKKKPLQTEINSAAISASDHYRFQLRSSEAGALELKVDGAPIGDRHAQKAGEMSAIDVPLRRDSNQLAYHFTANDGSTRSGVLTVKKIRFSDPANLYVSPQGKAGNDGSRQHPLDITTAADGLQAGGTLWLAPGEYPYTTLSASASGAADAEKKLRVVEGKAVFHGLNLEASRWDIEGIEVTGKSFTIAGSHNRIHKAVAHHADDTGIVITSPADASRSLWASHNLIAHSESYKNQDPGKINADGFAVKMRVGEGNRLVSCFSHDNIDDGYDLFNKIEDGPNGRVTIENSVALRNVNNGFKLGGEGLPVAHKVTGNIAIENGMDGFTDNFNPGALTVDHNTAIDNHRFNYIFRPGPYTTPNKQGSFENNVSLRTRPAKYQDAVVGNIADSNQFITGSAER